jgi:uncharacterized protein
VGAVVIGASAGVGRAIADQLGRLGTDLVIAARDDRDLTALASDLRIRHGVEVAAVPLDLNGSDAELRAVLADATAALLRIEGHARSMSD